MPSPMVRNEYRPVKEVFCGALIALVLVGCSRPLPEADTPVAALYVRRCGACHRAHAPASLKFPTWEMIVVRMEARIREGGQPQLTEGERSEILAYLRRNAG